jgi:hypothetical protein
MKDTLTIVGAIMGILGISYYAFIEKVRDEIFVNYSKCPWSKTIVECSSGLGLSIGVIGSAMVIVFSGVIVP